MVYKCTPHIVVDQFFRPQHVAYIFASYIAQRAVMLMASKLLLVAEASLIKVLVA